MDRIGVFVCSGCGIGDALDLAALQRAAAESSPAVCVDHPRLCSPAGVARIREAVDSQGLDGVLVAGCSARAKQREFAFDPTRVVVERVSLREQVAWSHAPQDEDTQLLGEDLLKMGLCRLAKARPPVLAAGEVERAVLVVGAGVAGIEAAAAAAGLGHPVVLVEASPTLGGHAATLRECLPVEPPYDELHPNGIGVRVAEVEASPRVRVFRNARVKAIVGEPGRFGVEIETPDGVEALTVGAIVQATGARPYDAARLAHLGYGRVRDVVTSHELEGMLAARQLRRPSDGTVPRRVVFVQCAGSRDPQHLAYCSADCCGNTLRQVALIQKDHPDVETVTVYRDMRTPGQMERFYAAVQSLPGRLFTRGEVAGVEGDGRPSVRLRDSLLGSDVVLDADLVVLAVGMVPASADGEAIRALRDARRRVETGDSETQREEARKVVEQLAGHEGTEILNLDYRQGPDLPVLGYGFPDSHFICFPYETRRTGVYAAGALRAPMSLAEAAEDGWGAAMKASQCIAALARGEAVHPRAGDIETPEFFLQRCTQCKRCTEECPFGTLNEDVKGTPQLNAARCRRCGICMGACPERIVGFPTYSVDAVAGMIKAMSVPEEFEEKPRILALLCENDALPALDAAAKKGRRWNPWVRVVPVRCLGSVNLVWIADSLSRGVDGVILVGCKRGEDYQCHYVRGSELAHTRLGNIQETLTRLALEPERVRIVELSHDESDRVADLLDEFASTLEGLGPSPLKGF
jgi:quinone-modifying oxidoreductase subunit QmoB